MTLPTSHDNYDDPRPICPECGEIVRDATTAAVLFRLKGDESWIIAPSIIKGVYCSDDHLLDAYLRGWPAAMVDYVDMPDFPDED